MVPPTFFGKVPEAPKLHEFKEKNKEASVKCDIAESKMFYSLKRYFESTGDDVLIIHSHDFLTKNVDIIELEDKDQPIAAPRGASAGASASELDGKSPPHEARGEYFLII